MSVADILKKYDATPEKVAASGVAAILEKYNATPENIAASFEKKQETPGAEIPTASTGAAVTKKPARSLEEMRSGLVEDGKKKQTGFVGRSQEFGHELNRFSRESLRAYAKDFIQTVKNIEE